MCVGKIWYSLNFLNFLFWRYWYEFFVEFLPQSQSTKLNYGPYHQLMDSYTLKISLIETIRTKISLIKTMRTMTNRVKCMTMFCFMNLLLVRLMSLLLLPGLTSKIMIPQKSTLTSATMISIQQTWVLMVMRIQILISKTKNLTNAINDSNLTYCL